MQFTIPLFGPEYFRRSVPKMPVALDIKRCTTANRGLDKVEVRPRQGDDLWLAQIRAHSPFPMLPPLFQTAAPAGMRRLQAQNMRLRAMAEGQQKRLTPCPVADRLPHQDR